MSSTTFKDNFPRYKRQYAALQTKRARSTFLDSICISYGCDRKYLNKLLKGVRRYRPHRGRAPSYSEESRKTLASLWLAVGQPCAAYMRGIMNKTVEDYIALGNNIPAEVRNELLKMSPSTMERSLRKTSWAHYRRNKTSGKNSLKASIPECPGSELPEDQVGTCQVDTVALCGGSMAGSFFYIGTVTDAKTQWFECAPTWNHGAENTAKAMNAILLRLPFEIRHMHPDNGSEFINRIFIENLAGKVPSCKLSRSRAYRKNDNCRIEQKNGSVIREYFSDIRFDDTEQYSALEALCRDIALYTNLFRPCKKLISKKRRAGRGVKYIKAYDAPRTPLERLTEEQPIDSRTQYYGRLYRTMNSIRLYKSIQSQLRRLVKTLNSGGASVGIPTPAPPEFPQVTFTHIFTPSVSMHLTEPVCR